MMTRKGNQMGSIGARRQKTAMRRPLLVGALTAGMIAVVASTAVAVGPVERPSSGPSTIRCTAANMMGSGAGVGGSGTGAKMMP